MPRINFVEKARKSPGQCGRCSTAIAVGQPYSWLSFRFGGKRVRCAKPECRFKRSDTTQSKLGDVYSAQETAEELLAKWDRKDQDALVTIVQDCGAAVREVYDDYESSAEEHPNLAGQTEEIRSELDGIAGELEDFSVDEFDPKVETQEAWAERVLEEAEAAIERVSEV